MKLNLVDWYFKMTQTMFGNCAPSRLITEVNKGIYYEYNWAERNSKFIFGKHESENEHIYGILFQDTDYDMDLQNLVKIKSWGNVPWPEFVLVVDAKEKSVMEAINKIDRSMGNKIENLFNLVDLARIHVRLSLSPSHFSTVATMVKSDGTNKKGRDYCTVCYPVRVADVTSKLHIVRIQGGFAKQKTRMLPEMRSFDPEMSKKDPFDPE